MTEITDAEVAEVQWASSDEGKAAVRAAHQEAIRLGMRSRVNDPAAVADTAMIVYAAYLAAGWDAGQAEEDDREPAGCTHRWTVLGAEDIKAGVPAFPLPMTCVACPARMETVIDGAWLCRRCADLYPEVMRLGPEIAARLREGGQQ